LTVSILIPAFRPTYLKQALGSVLTQGFEDYEVIVSDDCPGDEVAAVVETFRDPRIRYTRRTVGEKGGAGNTRHLWELARFDLIKFLFDDDILLPHALRQLVDLIAAHPNASFAFGQRDIIDESGRVTGEPRLIASGATVALGPEDFATTIVPGLNNRVGEFSNVLLNRKVGVTLDDMFVYRGFELEMLVDVGFYLTASAKGPGVGLGRVISQYRKHANQNSTIGFHPRFFKAFMEWELFLRGEYSAGLLTQEQALQAIDKLARGYTHWGQTLSELLDLRTGLEELRGQVLSGDVDVFNDSFRRGWNQAVEAADTRNAAAPSRLG
jgi:glycosyltransferase involved in cell wall biosynthesis